MIGQPVRLVLGGLAALGVAVGTPFVVAEATEAEAPREARHRDGPRGRAEVDVYLAEALDISVEELEAARDEAHAAMLADAVDAGTLAPEQAELMAARRALADYTDRAQLTAEALGLSIEELEAARAAGTSLRTLVEDAGLTPAAFRMAVEQAYEASVAQAVADGVITPEQAELVLAQRAERGTRGPGPGGRGPGGPPDG